MPLHHRAVLLDLDDTLLDYVDDQRGAVVDTLAWAGLPTDEATLEHYGRVNHEHWVAHERGDLGAGELRVARWTAFLAAVGSDADPGEVSARHVARFSQRARLLPGARDVVAELARRHDLVVVTNGFADAQRARVAVAGLGPYLRGLVASDDVEAGKPHAAPFLAALAVLGDPDPSEVVMVGDSLSADVAGADALGIDTVWYAPHGRDAPTDGPRPGRTIRELHELVA